MARVSFRFSGTEQSTGRRHVPIGALTDSTNVRQVKDGELGKRPGLDRRTVQTWITGTRSVSASGIATELGEWSDGALFRDDDDNVWFMPSEALQPGGSVEASFRGTNPRCFLTSTAAGHELSKAHKGSVVKDSSGRLWIFSIGEATEVLDLSQSYNQYRVTVYDRTGQSVVVPTMRFASIGIRHYSAVYDGSRYIWFFYVDGGASILLDRWDTQNVTTNAVLGSVFLTTSTAKFNQVSATRLTNGDVWVAYQHWQHDNATLRTARTTHSKLDMTTRTSTGGAHAQNENIARDGVNLNSGVRWLVGDSSTDFGRYVWWVKDTASGSADKVRLVQARVNFSTHGVSTGTIDWMNLGGTTGVSGTVVAGVCSGYSVDHTGSVVFGHVVRPWNYATGSVKVETNRTYNSEIRRYMFNLTASLSDETFARGAWLASDPFQDDSVPRRWFVQTAYDDGQDNRLQRCVQVRRADHEFGSFPEEIGVIAQTVPGLGPAICHGWASDMSGTAFLGTTFVSASTPWVSPVVDEGSGQGIRFSTYGTSDVDGLFRTEIQLMKMQFEPDLSRGAVMPNGSTVYPGGVPTVAGPRDSCHDLSPLLFPSMAASCSLGTGNPLQTSVITYGYRFRDLDGTLYRSSPNPTFVTASFKDGGGRVIGVQNLRSIGTGEAEIEIWASASGSLTPRLQAVVPNDPSSDRTDVSVDPSLFSHEAEPLPFLGGALSPSPPPGCRLVDVWRGRLFVGDVDGRGLVRFSKEFEPGLGPLMNEILAVNPKTPGPVNAMGPVDWNYFAILREDRPSVISGPGPDGLGRGNYEVSDLNERSGVGLASDRGTTVVPSQLGLFFQDRADGRIRLLSSGLRIVDVSEGIEDLICSGSATAVRSLVAGRQVPRDRQVWLQLDDGRMAVLETAWPTAARPWGQWRAWTSDALSGSTSVGMAVSPSGAPIFMTTDLGIRTPATGSLGFVDARVSGSYAPVLRTISTGLLSFGSSGPSQEEMQLKRLKVLGQHKSATTFDVIVTNDFNETERLSAPQASTHPFDYTAFPTGTMRTQEVRVTLQETSILSSSLGEGFVVDALGLEWENEKKLKDPDEGKRIP